MSDPEDRVGGLLQELSTRLPEQLHENVLIFGSSAIVLNGVCLDRQIDDLDVFVSEETFDGLRSMFAEEWKRAKEGCEIPYLEIGDKIELLASFPGVEFNDVFSRSQVLPHSAPFRVAALRDLRLWKVEQGRPKDMNDIKAIDRWLELTEASQ